MRSEHKRRYSVLFLSVFLLLRKHGLSEYRHHGDQTKQACAFVAKIVKYFCKQEYLTLNVTLKVFSETVTYS